MLQKNESSATRLLISVLIRYPEVSSVRYDPQSKSLVFSFFIKGNPTKEQQFACEDELRTYLETCSNFSRKCATMGKLLFTTLDDITLLTYQQSIHLVSTEELVIVTHVLQLHFPEQAASDPLGLEYSDIEQQEEIINRLLGHPETLDEDQLLVAYREDGKVYIYNN